MCEFNFTKKTSAKPNAITSKPYAFYFLIRIVIPSNIKR